MVLGEFALHMSDSGSVPGADLGLGGPGPHWHTLQTGCRYGLIAPQPPVARVLRITRLDQRLPVFATIGDALAHLAPIASAQAQ
jgi:hypothetical protein